MFTKLLKLFVTLVLIILKVKARKCFLYQISLEVDVPYNKNNKMAIFYVRWLLKSFLKLRKFYKSALKSFVNMALDA